MPGPRRRAVPFTLVHQQLSKLSLLAANNAGKAFKTPGRSSILGHRISRRQESGADEPIDLAVPFRKSVVPLLHHRHCHAPPISDSHKMQYLRYSRNRTTTLLREGKLATPSHTRHPFSDNRVAERSSQITLGAFGMPFSLTPDGLITPPSDRATELTRLPLSIREDKRLGVEEHIWLLCWHLPTMFFLKAPPSLVVD